MRSVTTSILMSFLPTVPVVALLVASSCAPEDVGEAPAAANAKCKKPKPPAGGDTAPCAEACLGTLDGCADGFVCVPCPGGYDSCIEGEPVCWPLCDVYPMSEGCGGP